MAAEIEWERMEVRAIQSILATEFWGMYKSVPESGQEMKGLYVGFPIDCFNISLLWKTATATEWMRRPRWWFCISIRRPGRVIFHNGALPDKYKCYPMKRCVISQQEDLENIRKKGVAMSFLGSVLERLDLRKSSPNTFPFRTMWRPHGPWIPGSDLSPVFSEFLYCLCYISFWSSLLTNWMNARMRTGLWTFKWER